MSGLVPDRVSHPRRQPARCRERHGLGCRLPTAPVGLTLAEGFEIGFAVNPVLAGPEVPPLSLEAQADPPPRLGWNTWIPAPEGPPLGTRRPDAAEALFEAELIEAEERTARARY